MIVYISIGNSDDKLSQREWSAFYTDVTMAIRDVPVDPEAAPPQVHGQWVSEPASAWQNACWCIDLSPVSPAYVRHLRQHLRIIAARYRQDSILWAAAPTVEFLHPQDTTHDD